jgi:hypothetical protein
MEIENHSSGPAPAHNFGLLAQPNRGSGPCTGMARRVATARWARAQRRGGEAHAVRRRPPG